MKRQNCVLMAAVLGAAWGGAAYGQNITLQHTNSIDLSSLFSATSGFGNNSLSVAFDGTNAYVGGYNNTAEAGNIGVVQVQNVLGAAPALNGLAGTQFSSPASRGLDALASDGTYLYLSHDAGTPGASFIQKIRLSDLGSQWKTFSPNDVRPFAMALDPKGDAGTQAVAFLSQGHGRRLALRDSDGSVLYTISGGANPGGIINSAPALGASWRALAFDSNGNIALAEDSGVAYGVRSADNVWTDLGGTANQTTRSVLKSVAQNNVGNGVTLLEGVAANPLLVFSPRSTGTGASGAAITLTDSLGGTTAVNSGDVQIRNRDGTATGLAQTQLLGNEDGIGAAFTTELKNFAVGRDANGQPVLLVSSSLERRLDVYQMEPTFVGDASTTWAGGTWLAGVVPNSATLNARFGPTTGARTITVAGQTTKNLKIDSPNAYTFAGGTLNIDAPAGQNGNVQVLQGAHSIQSPLALAKNTVFSVAAGAGLSVSGGVTGAGGITKSGSGVMTLTGANAVAGPLAVGAGTLRLGGSVTAVSALTVDAAANLEVNQGGSIAGAAAEGTADAVRALLSTGRAGGAWSGVGGISSASAAAGAGATGVGYLVRNGGTELLIKYTYNGDANLDGRVNGDDYALVDRGFALGTTNAHWVDGDFNYDGVLDTADYLLIDTGFGKQTGVLSAELLADREGRFGAAYVAQLVAAVPEPGSVGLALVAAAGLVGRRRR